MSWTCSWLLKGPGASHLYTQLYTLYVKGTVIDKLISQAYSAANSAPTCSSCAVKG